MEKRTEKDVDYHPELEGIVKSKKSKQLENRNIMPNIIRLVLSYVQKPGKSSRLVEELIRKDGLPEASLKRYFLYHRLVRDKMENYVRM